jgi:hypothetical protein
LSHKMPLDIYDTHARISEGVESSHGQVDGVLISTSGAVVCYGHSDALSVALVSDLHLLPTERRSTSAIAIPGLIFD